MFLARIFVSRFNLIFSPLPFCYCKKQMDDNVSCVFPVIDHELRHNIVKVVCGSTRLSPRNCQGCAAGKSSHPYLQSESDSELSSRVYNPSLDSWGALLWITRPLLFWGGPPLRSYVDFNPPRMKGEWFWINFRESRRRGSRGKSTVAKLPLFSEHSLPLTLRPNRAPPPRENTHYSK